jgi:hypothetical protein
MLDSTRPGGKDLREKGGYTGITGRSGHGTRADAVFFDPVFFLSLQQGNNAETFHLLCCPVFRTVGAKQSCGLV